ncbi:serine hydrolase FSH [Daldinia caldariorum]|uniref:serine hydrolase FSH n=1 Tax=Daldinia caldariorum TaxID=326644 RepID=UPI002007E9C3|nr:serine hydrolase FSH [Daldinia caldariorum]KAI1467649.1 serine hydrolase FSH [Daldinia caldariorum]
MRILCLHGDSQNENILKSELAALLSRLQNSTPNLSFEFVNGPLQYSNLLVKDPPPPESHGYKFYDAEEVKDIRKAGEWLAAILDRDGPYDGVLAVSQGAAAVSSFLLYRQWYEHELPPAFRFAIFINGSIPLKVLKDLGVPVSNEAEMVVAEANLQRDQALGPLPAHTSKARRAVFNSDDCFGLNLNRIPLELKIRIPTVHVWGENDPLFPASVQLTGLCDPYIRKIQMHKGSHEVPRDEEGLSELVSLIDWCIQRATWPGQMQL